jgi:hypothetical protein
LTGNWNGESKGIMIFSFYILDILHMHSWRKYLRFWLASLPKMETLMGRTKVLRATSHLFCTMNAHCLSRVLFSSVVILIFIILQ